jgi:hypothetical protein
MLDIGDAHPAWTGYFDFATLTVGTIALVWLVRVAARERDRHESKPGRRTG